MTKPDWCTREVWERAEMLVVSVNGDATESGVYNIARALMEAERRGMEKAASIAEPFVSYGDPVDASVGLGPIGKRIAAAIRAKAQEVV